MTTVTAQSVPYPVQLQAWTFDEVLGITLTPLEPPQPGHGSNAGGIGHCAAHPSRNFPLRAPHDITRCGHRWYWPRPGSVKLAASSQAPQNAW